MYDKDNSLHHNGAKLMTTLKTGNAVRSDMARKINDMRHPRDVKTQAQKPKPLTSAP